MLATTRVFIELIFETKEYIGQAKTCQPSSIRIGDVVNNSHCIINRDISVNRDNVKAKENFPSINLSTLKFINKGSWVFDRGFNMAYNEPNILC